MGLNFIILKACQTAPAQRYKSAADLAVDLMEDRRAKPGKSRAAIWLGLGLALAAAGTGATFWGLETRTQSAAPVSDGLPRRVAWWDAEGGLNDRVNGLEGIARRGVTFVPGKTGQAFYFDGMHSGIGLGNPPMLHLQDLTIAAWIKRGDAFRVARDGPVAHLLSYGFGGYYFTLASNGCLTFGQGGGNSLCLTNPAITDTNWHHVAVGKSGTAITFFLDGAAYPVPGPYQATFTFTRDVAIGTSGESFLGGFFGTIDELEIYDGMLTAPELEAIYHAVNLRPEPARALPGIVHWWRAEGDARDSIGGNDGALINDAGFAPGIVGQAFSFDGIDSYVKVPHSADLNVTNRLTLEFWMKADPKNSMGAPQGLVTTDFYGIEIAGGYTWGRMGASFFISTDAGASNSSASYPDTATPNDGGAVMSVGEWHHVAATYDGVKLQLYLDGRPWRQPTLHSGAISPMLTNSFLSIGSEDGRGICGSCPGTRYFKGLIDEVALYNRPLSADEIAGIYDAGAATIRAANRASRPSVSAPHAGGGATSLPGTR